MMSLPANILGIIPFGVITIAIGVWVMLSESASSTPSARRWMLGIGLALVAWFVAAFTLTRSGLFLGEGLLPGLRLGLALALPVLIGVMAYRALPALRAIVDAVPVHWLIGFQFARNLGIVFLVLADIGLLPTVFAYPAGYGDVLVGLLAPLVALAYFRRKPYARGLAIIWNVIGLLDFAVALGTALANVDTFTSPVVLSHIQLIPTFGVPLFILLHLATLRQLTRRQAERIAFASLASNY